MQSESFERKLIRFVGELCQADGIRAEIRRDTPLFGQKLIDSRRVVDLMGFVEREIGAAIPDDKLSMQYFASVATISQVFLHGATPAPDDVAPGRASFGAPDVSPRRDAVTALVQRGDIAADDNGCIVLRGIALDLHTYFAGLFAGLGARHGAVPRRYPTLLPLADLQRTDYFRSFPQHATFCTCLRHDGETLQHFVSDVKEYTDVAPATQGRLEAPAMVLSSAVCYHCYREHAGKTLLPGLTLVTAQGQCFRNERGAFRTLDRQYEFAMREIILMGDPALIERARDQLLEEAIGIAAGLGFAGTVEPATDMFYRDDVQGRARALHQRASELKYELRVRMDEHGASLAVASFNLHGDYFGRSFDISTTAGMPACTGCVGFGLERWVSAFLAYRGAEPGGWPAAVREALAR